SLSLSLSPSLSLSLSLSLFFSPALLAVSLEKKMLCLTSVLFLSISLSLSLFLSLSLLSLSLSRPDTTRHATVTRKKQDPGRRRGPRFIRRDRIQARAGDRSLLAPSAEADSRTAASTGCDGSTRSGSLLVRIRVTST